MHNKPRALVRINKREAASWAVTMLLTPLFHFYVLKKRGKVV